MIVNLDPSPDFLPVPEELVVNLMDSKQLVYNLLEKLPSMFSDSTALESNIQAAIKSISLIGKPTGAKVYFFQGSPLSSKFPLLKPTEKPGVVDRNELLQSTNAQFKNTASDLSHFYISIDLFVVCQHGTFMNLQTFSDLSKYTNGRLFYYQRFQAQNDGIKLDTEFTSALTAKVAWEAVGRIRVSSGYTQVGTYGNFLVKSRTQDLLSLPVCDEHRTFFYELEKADTPAQDPGRI